MSRYCIARGFFLKGGMSRMIIGIDHGYSAMKTKHCSFPSGVIAYEHEPYTNKGVLLYKEKFYVCGSGRQPLIRA